MSCSVLFVQHKELAVCPVLSVSFILVFRLQWMRCTLIYKQGLMLQTPHQASFESFHKFSNFFTVLTWIYINFTCCNHRNSNPFFVTALRKVWQTCQFCHYTNDKRRNLCRIQKVSRLFTFTGFYIAANNIMRKKTTVLFLVCLPLWKCIWSRQDLLLCCTMTFICVYS
jgi:hypothetical protein